MQSVNLTREQAEFIFYELMAAHLHMMTEIGESKKKIAALKNMAYIKEQEEWIKKCSDHGDKLIEVASIMRNVMYAGQEMPECITN